VIRARHRATAVGWLGVAVDKCRHPGQRRHIGIQETEVLDEFVVAGCRRDISPTVKLRSDGQRRPQDVERRLSVDGNDCLAPLLCESRAAAAVGGSQLWRDFAFAEGLAVTASIR